MTMRQIVFFALIVSALLSFSFQQDASYAPRQTFYFFCMSREVPTQQNAVQSLRFCYTDIREFSGQESDLTHYTRQFATYIQQHCKGENESCTSDLNYYPSRADALKRYNEYLNKYAQGDRYKLERIDFQFK